MDFLKWNINYPLGQSLKALGFQGLIYAIHWKTLGETDSWRTVSIKWRALLNFFIFS